MLDNRLRCCLNIKPALDKPADAYGEGESQILMYPIPVLTSVKPRLNGSVWLIHLNPLTAGAAYIRAYFLKSTF